LAQAFERKILDFAAINPAKAEHWSQSKLLE
jgi:hypothetical protein